MTLRELRIESTIINDDSDAFVIAEIGHNHQGNVETCKELFRAAKESGADAVKLQKRDNKNLYTKAFYNSIYNSENAYGSTYGEHREYLEFGKAEYQELQAYAKELGIIFFATAFDHNSADFLADLDVPCYKLASGDLTNIPLMEHVAKIGKPMIISTGAADLVDVVRAYEAIMPINPQLAILQCTATYPSDFSQLDLRVISTYRELFSDIVVGLSAHDNGIAMAVAAYMLGGRIIEKHFTLNRTMKGTDHVFSLEPLGMKKMIRDLKRTRQALGNSEKRMYDNERSARNKMGKMIVAARPLPAGHVLQEGDLMFKSPAEGLPPYMVKELYGKPLAVNLTEDEPLALEHVQQSVLETV
jgi:N-acetylneuraminate synthase/sialic acid synthase